MLTKTDRIQIDSAVQKLLLATERFARLTAPEDTPEHKSAEEAVNASHLALFSTIEAVCAQQVSQALL